ncbi:MAG: cation:proton antiporter [Pseudomonadota bacterium]
MADLGGLSVIVGLLGVGLVAATAARAVGFSPIVGYLVAGAIIGEHALGLVHDSKTTHLLAEAGVIFLLFDIGLHLSLRDLWASRRDLFAFGPSQVVLCALLLGLILLAFGIPLAAAVILALALALSSTALVVQGLIERDLQSAPIGRKAIAVLIFQDVCAVAILVGVQFAGDAGETSIAVGLGLAALKAVAAVATVMLIGRFILKPVFAWIVATKQVEIFTTAALMVVLGTALLTGAAGLSLPLGAFLAGLILSESEYCYLVKAELRPFRSLLLGFFFLTVGMMLDLSVLISTPALIVSVLAALIVVKSGIVFALARATGMPLSSAARLSLFLAQGSEFAFVVFALAGANGLIEPNVSGALIAAVTLSMIVTPGVWLLADRLASRFAHDSNDETVDGDATGRVLVLGFGPSGRALGRALSAAGRNYVIATDDPTTFAEAQVCGFEVAFGPPDDAGFRDAAGGGAATAIVLAAPNQSQQSNLLEEIRRQYPDQTVLVAELSTTKDQDGNAVTRLNDGLIKALRIDEQTAEHILSRERRETVTAENESSFIPARAG